MRNQYLQNLNRIEFSMTYACTCRCKHCALGNDLNRGKHIDGRIAAEAVGKIANVYDIESVMTFGGEPLIYYDDVFEIHKAAREANIEKRQIITNGFFTKDNNKIEIVSKGIVDSGVNDILVSVDAFHQETIPIGYVIKFVEELLKNKALHVRVHPVWLVSVNALNTYNDKTRELLKIFENMGIGTSNGNIISPKGNALKYLNEYFDVSSQVEDPYADDFFDVSSICFSPDGSVLGDYNFYNTDVLTILENYVPKIQ